MAFIILEKLMIGCLGRQCGRFQKRKKCLVDVLFYDGVFTCMRTMERETDLFLSPQVASSINFKPLSPCLSVECMFFVDDIILVGMIREGISFRIERQGEVLDSKGRL